MHDEVWFEGRFGGERFVLLPSRDKPFHSGQYKELARDEAIRHIVFAISARTSNPHGPLLHALGIDRHPMNISHGDLELMVAQRFRAFPPLKVLRQLPFKWPTTLPIAKLRQLAEVATAQVEPSAYIGIEAASESGSALPGVMLELTLPDQSVRTVVTNDKGQALVQRIPQGNCKIALPKLDASRWKPSGGANTVIRKEPGPTHAVQQGECLSQIAHQHGYDDWQKIWSDPKNAALKAKRKSPHVLLPGDQIVLPGIEVGQIERSTDAVHRIILNVKPVEVEVVLVFKDSEGEPIKDEPYELTYKDGSKDEKRTGALDGAGQLREKLPVTVRSAEVLLTGPGAHHTILLGHLDPAQDDESTAVASGAAARLMNLGFLSREPGEGPLNELRSAVMAFQHQVMGQAEPTGELDAATCARIEREHGV